MQSTVSSFWTRWLLVVSIAGVGLGVFLFASNFISHSAGALYYDHYVGAGAFATLTNPELNFQQFLYGVMGAVMAAWMVTLAFIIHIPFRRGEKWAWYAIDIGTVLWFIGDSYVSIVTGFEVHALINVSLLVAIGLPLLLTYRQFHPPSPTRPVTVEAR